MYNSGITSGAWMYIYKYHLSKNANTVKSQAPRDVDIQDHLSYNANTVKSQAPRDVRRQYHLTYNVPVPSQYISLTQRRKRKGMMWR